MSGHITSIITGGEDLYEQKRYEEAIAQFNEAIRLDPQLTNAYYKRGNAYDDLGQYERAIQDYDEAIRLDPQYADAYANRAIAHTILGEEVAAQKNLARAVELGVDQRILEDAIERAKSLR